MCQKALGSTVLRAFLASVRHHKQGNAGQESCVLQQKQASGTSMYASMMEHK